MSVVQTVIKIVYQLCARGSCLVPSWQEIFGMRFGMLHLPGFTWSTQKHAALLHIKDELESTMIGNFGLPLKMFHFNVFNIFGLGKPKQS